MESRVPAYSRSRKRNRGVGEKREAKLRILNVERRELKLFP